MVPSSLRRGRVKARNIFIGFVAFLLLGIGLVNLHALSYLTNHCATSSPNPRSPNEIHQLQERSTTTTTTTTTPKEEEEKKDTTISEDDKDDYLKLKSIQQTLMGLYESLPEPRVKDDDNGRLHMNYRELSNLYTRQRFVEVQDITLVTHGSVSKLPMLIEQMVRWEGPISFVIYLQSTNDIQVFCEFLRDNGTTQFLNNTSIHAVLEKHGGTLPYPVNVLRNLAQRSIESNFFLLMDVDFLPSKGAYAYLMQTLQNTEHPFWDQLRNNTVFVLPAFERFPLLPNGTATADLVPEYKLELKQMLKQQVASTFHPYFPPGHQPTDYDLWLDDGLDTEFSYPIQYVKRFEPYVIAYKRGLPEFWDGFRGFGYNAATFFWELHLAGYQYRVIRRQFVVHMNHPGRNERAIQDGSIAKLQLRRFLRYVSRKYDLNQTELRYWKGRRYGDGTHVTHIACAHCDKAAAAMQNAAN